MGNEARRGGRGGGMENLGEAYFSRASYFMANSAGGECDPMVCGSAPATLTWCKAALSAHVEHPYTRVCDSDPVSFGV